MVSVVRQLICSRPHALSLWPQGDLSVGIILDQNARQCTDDRKRASAILSLSACAVNCDWCVAHDHCAFSKMVATGVLWSWQGNLLRGRVDVNVDWLKFVWKRLAFRTQQDPHLKQDCIRLCPHLLVSWTVALLCFPLLPLTPCFCL